MEYCDCFFWFNGRNFQYFANGGYFLQWKRLEFIYWGPNQIRSWTFFHSIWHFIYSPALRFLQTKNSFKIWDYFYLLVNKNLPTLRLVSFKYSKTIIPKIFTKTKCEANLIYFKPIVSDWLVQLGYIAKIMLRLALFGSLSVLSSRNSSSDSTPRANSIFAQNCKKIEIDNFECVSHPNFWTYRYPWEWQK